jgi:type IV pilus assembly protein PilE
MPRQPSAHRSAPLRSSACRGFTLVEVATVCAMVGVLAAVALPGYQGQLRQAGRSDAVAALVRVQQAQEQYRSHHGMYADDFSVLRGASQTVSEQGGYRLQLRRTGGESYIATAQALPGSRQAGDGDCATLTLEVRLGFAQTGPSTRCWNR